MIKAPYLILIKISAMFFEARQAYSKLFHVMLCYAMLCYAVLCCAVLCCALLYYDMI